MPGTAWLRLTLAGAGVPAWPPDQGLTQKSEKRIELFNYFHENESFANVYAASSMLQRQGCEVRMNFEVPANLTAGALKLYYLETTIFIFQKLIYKL